MIPISLSLENFISHSKSYLDFTKFETALVVGSHFGNPDISNGVGKTALFDAMCWALFGKSRFSTKDKVVKRGKSECSVEFTFAIGDEQYRVTRKLDIRANLHDVVFYKKEGDVWESKSYTGDTNTVTNNNIFAKIGVSYDAFTNVVYFRQNDISGFASAPTSKRKDILKDILQIEIWDKFQEDAKEHKRKLVQRHDSITARINGLGNIDNEQVENAEKIKKVGLELKNAQENVKDLEHQIRKYDDEIATLELSLSKLGKTNRKRLEERLQGITDRANDIKAKRLLLVNRLKLNNETIVISSNECAQLELRLIELAKDVLVVSHNTREETEKLFVMLMETKSHIPIESIPKIQHGQDILEGNKKERDKYRRSLDILKLQLKQLTTLSPDSECPTCLSNIDDVDSVIRRRATKQKFLENGIIEKQALLEECIFLVNRDIGAIDKANNSSLEIQRVGLIISKHKSSIDEAIRHNEDIQEENVRLKSEWSSLKETKQKIESVLNQSKSLNKVQKELEGVYDNKKSVFGKLETARTNAIELSVRYGNLEGHAEELERRSSERQTLNAQLDSILFDIEAYGALVRTFGKDGIQAIIMENVTEDLRSYTNSILQNICSDPMSIDFVTQKQTGTGSWREDFDVKISMNNATLDFEDLSGGEQVRVAFALRLALSRLLMRRIGSNIRFLLLDEVDQSLDKYGIDVLSETIHTLSSEFKILVITHNELMKEKFEHIVSIQKMASGSTLSQ